MFRASRGRRTMEHISLDAAAVFRRLLDAQPTTPAKVAFAWKMAAGRALARATEAEWREGGVLVVRARTEAWRHELRQARGLLSARLVDWLGPDVVRRLDIE